MRRRVLALANRKQLAYNCSRKFNLTTIPQTLNEVISVRCSQCDRIVSKGCIGRLPNNTLAFGWCRGCLEVAGGVTIEISPRVNLFGQNGRVVVPMGGTSWDSTVARSKQRMFAMSMLSAVLGFWGFTMTLTGFLKTDEPTPANPLGNGSSILLVVGGGGLMGTAFGLILGVWRTRRNLSRPRSIPQKPRIVHPANALALAGLVALGMAVFVSDSKISAYSVIFAIPCFIASWYWLSRKSLVKSGIAKSDQKPIEV